MNISEALKETRKRTLINQKEFAEHIGITQTYISLVESGKKTPSLDVIEKWAKLSKTPIAIILWKAIDEKDVLKTKRKAFNELKPLIDNLIAQIF